MNSTTDSSPSSNMGTGIVIPSSVSISTARTNVTQKLAQIASRLQKQAQRRCNTTRRHAIAHPKSWLVDMLTYNISIEIGLKPKK